MRNSSSTMDDQRKDGVDGLSSAAAKSVKQAVGRARVRKARAQVQRGVPVTTSSNDIEVGVRSQTTLPYDSGKSPLPYHRRRKSHLPGAAGASDDEGDDDSNDEWEEHVDVDEKSARAAVAAAKAAAEAAAQRVARARKAAELASTQDPIAKRRAAEAEKKALEEQRIAYQKAQSRIAAARLRSRALARHEAHLVLLLSMMVRMDDAAENEELRALAMSTVPSDAWLRDTHGKLENLGRFALWFRAVYDCRGLFPFKSGKMVVRRACAFAKRAKLGIKREAAHILDLAVLAAAMIRTEGIRCRIVVPLQLMSSVPQKTAKAGSKGSGRLVNEQVISRDIDLGFYAWLEVFSEGMQKWVPVDIVTGQVNVSDTASVISNIFEHCKLLLDISSSNLDNSLDRLSSARAARAHAVREDALRKAIDVGVLAHVVAVENRILHDVTRRYVKNWRDVDKRRSKGRIFERVLEGLSSSTLEYVTEDPAHRIEQEEFDTLSAGESIPTSVAALHKHPRYILERHLKKYELVHPRKPIVGYLKKEPIFLRSHVRLLHTKDRWIRKMREVRKGEKPVKHVKSMKRDGEEMTPLFGEWQTDPLIVPSVKDGKVPRNERGNVDLWTEAHMPVGAVHLSSRFAAAAARSLGFDFAPAMTGFELRSGRSVPRIEGIIIAAENAEATKQEALAREDAAKERAEAKAREDACKRWAALLRAMDQRERVRKKYGGLVQTGTTYEGIKKQQGLEIARQEKLKDLKRDGPDGDSFPSAGKGQGTKRKPARNEDSLDEQNTPAVQESPPKIRKTQGTTQAHEHKYSEPKEAEDGVWVKSCVLCGLEVTFEQL